MPLSPHGARSLRFGIEDSSPFATIEPAEATVSAPSDTAEFPAEALAEPRVFSALDGGAGPDTLSGGDGHDVINGGGGNDVLYGHSVADLDPASGRIAITRLTDGIGGALFATFAPGDPGFLYVVAKDGDIIRVDTTTGARTTFMDLPANVLSTAGEGGLLGLAFAPNYATTGKFYVHVTDPAGSIEVREYTRSAGNPLVADLSTARTLITIPHPTNTNHYGGFVGFSPTDGFLYISTGDGGGGGDPPNNAQNVNVLIGKILRIDVNSDGFPSDPARNYAIPASNPFATSGGAPEIWAYGLRNPWRASFDANGDFFIADVGQEQREEINYQANGAAAGRNYGWRIMEGSIPFVPVANPPPMVGPTYEYDHSVGISVIGGHVYRGPSPGLQGAYIFSDFNAQPYLSLRIVNGQATDVINHRAQEQLIAPAGGLPGFGVTSFGVDSAGRLYFVTFSGSVYSFDPTVAAGDGGDTIHGDDGDDRLYGGAGKDALFGDAGADQLFGGDAADGLFGGVDADRLEGAAGNDILDGGAGVDTMVGGLGSDSYAVDVSGDVVTELANEGFDTVYAAFNYALGANLEGLYLTGAAVSGVGNALANSMVGNGLANYLGGEGGADVLQGGAADDILEGGAGNDILFGGTGSDSYGVDSSGDAIGENAGEGFDAVYSTGDYTLGANLEGLYLLGSATSGFGNTLANALYGNDLANYLRGAEGDDYLSGGVGDDILEGSSGNDIMVGGVGSDSYGVDSSGDVIGENVGEGFDSVYSTASYTLGADLEGLYLLGTAIEAVGNSLANAIFGNASNNVINGGAGNDVLNGGAGDDTFVYRPGTGQDVINGFVAGGTEDRLDFSAYAGTGIAYVLSQSGANAVFAFSNGDNIILANVTAANLVQSGDYWL